MKTETEIKREIDELLRKFKIYEAKYNELSKQDENSLSCKNALFYKIINEYPMDKLIWALEEPKYRRKIFDLSKDELLELINIHFNDEPVMIEDIDEIKSENTEDAKWVQIIFWHCVDLRDGGSSVTKYILQIESNLDINLFFAYPIDEPTLAGLTNQLQIINLLQNMLTKERN